MTNLTFPRPTDKWCESTLHPEEGDWTPSAGYVEVSDMSAVGISSVRIYSPHYNYYISGNFTLKYWGGLDTTYYANTKLHFTVAIDVGMTGMGQVLFYDGNGKLASRNISCSTAGVWQQINCDMSEFVAEAGFDWKHVLVIRFVGNQKSGQGGSMWIDDFYFSMDVPDSTLVIQSLPSGKNYTITDWLYGSESYITNSSVTRPQGLTSTIQMDVTGFNHWEDQPTNINPTRDFTFLPTNMVLTADYSVPHPTNPLLVIDSFDQDMNVVSGVSAVKLVFSGIPQFVNVPFGGRVGKGSWSFTAVNTATRKFNHWKMPNGVINASPSVTFDVQADSRFEVHWQSSETPPDGGIPWALIVGIVSIGLVGGVGLYFYSKKRKK